MGVGGVFPNFYARDIFHLVTILIISLEAYALSYYLNECWLEIIGMHKICSQTENIQDNDLNINIFHFLHMYQIFLF